MVIQIILILFLNVALVLPQGPGDKNADKTEGKKSGEDPEMSVDEPIVRDRSFALEFSGGLSGGEFQGAASGLEMNNGSNWRVSALYSPLKWLSAYAGYGQTTFGCTRGFCSGEEVLFTGKGIDAGLKLNAGGLWVGAGILNHQLDIAWDGGQEELDVIKSSPGVSLRAGFALPLSHTFSVEIGGHYAAYQITYPGVSRPQNVTYLSGEVRLQLFLF